MQLILIVIDSLVLAAAGILHIYWAAGGQWARAEVAPTDAFAQKLEQPRGKMLTRFIGLLCFVGVLVLLGRGGLLDLPLGGQVWVVGCWIMAGLFTLRALFGFLGSTVIDTGSSEVFDYWNLRLFSPLFLFLGATIALVNIL